MSAPSELLEEVCRLRFPPQTDARLQALRDKNNNGALSAEQREELESLVALSEKLSLLRAKALHALGRKPNGHAE